MGTGAMIAWILGILLLLAVVGILALATVLMRIAAKPHRSDIPRSIQYVKNQGLYGEFDGLKKEEIVIPSFDGYELHGFYIPAEKDSNRYVAITHGITDTCYGSVRYANFYHRLGYHVVMYDLRNHGINKKTYTTMGIRECRDLREVIGYMRKRFGGSIELGIHGESLGSATSLLCLDDGLRLSFCVADCGYSDLWALMTYLVKGVYHVPAFFIPIGNLLVKLFYHYSFSEIKPIENVKKNHTPILFMHGEADTYIPCSMSQEMYEVNPGYKEIHLFAGAEHAMSIAKDPKRYYRVLKEFLEKVQQGVGTQGGIG